MMDFVEPDMVTTFSKLYPEAQMDTSSFTKSNDNQMTEEKALGLVKQAHPELEGKVTWYVEEFAMKPGVFSVTGNTGRSTPPVFIVTSDGSIYKDFEYFEQHPFEDE